MEPADLRGVDLEPAAGTLLIAAPSLVDPNFAHTVVLLLDVDADGFLGVVLNRPSGVAVGAVLQSWADSVGAPSVLFEGGPVGTDSALAVGRLGAPAREPLGGAPIGWRPLFDATGLVDLDTPAELLAPVLSGMRIYAGYAGWSADQLRDEIDQGAWYVVASAPDDAFYGRPDDLWQHVLRRQPGRLAWLATYPQDPSQN